ncbi:MAG TPA: type II/IV secretion system protein, partial [Candidatus Omnitrophica bacterium]|nr:type II/IV secretion system protein [Candidatus Omnitrophota bacterium]
PKGLQPAVISRVKIMSGMDIAERRKPQDGRMVIGIRDREYDIRVSTLPDIFGEKVVLRILDKKSILISLDKLGLDENERSIIESLIYQPYGMILVTGPTGSGKTTTLYSILNKLNDATRNIVTVEDPVEYELEGINQTAVNVRAGYTFATGMRHILRQDPDVIMIGEIRDLETAEIAIQAALTGHLVLSTLHTNNAPGAINRLLDMNVEPFLISASLIGIIAQRLVRKLCPYCRQDYTPSEDLMKEISEYIPEPKKVKFAKSSGCERCKNLGYYRRTGIFEIVRITPQMKELILKRATEKEVTDLAIREGMHTLQQSGVVKALQKITSIEEVMRVAFVKKI